MSSAAAKRTDRTRKAILLAGEKLFLANGFSGTSMDQIAKVAGVSKQTVYTRLRSKEELFLNVVEAMTGAAGDELAETVADPAAGGSLSEFLRAFAEEQLHIVLTSRLVKLRRLVIGEVGRFPELGVMLHRRGPGRSIERLSMILARFRSADAIDVPNPDEAAAYFNWLLMGGPVNDAMLLGDAAIPSEAAKRHHANECVRIFLSAYPTPDVR